MIRFGAIPIDAALFDLDGTLVRSRIDFALMRSEITRLAVDAGVAGDALEGKEILEMVDAAARSFGAEREAELRNAMWLRLEQIERDGCDGSESVSGADELLRRLRSAGVKTGIVTRNCRAVSMPLLDRLSLQFDVLLTRDDVARCKPDPAHLRDALAALGCAAERSLMAGDHWLDVQAGRECGCAATVGVLGDHHTDWFSPCPPNFLLRDLTDTLALLAE